MMTNVTSSPSASKHKGRNLPACRALRLAQERLKAPFAGATRYSYRCEYRNPQRS